MFEQALGNQCRTAPPWSNNHDTVGDRLIPVMNNACLLYTSDAADDLLCVDLGGRRLLKKKNQPLYYITHTRLPRLLSIHVDQTDPNFAH